MKILYLSTTIGTINAFLVPHIKILIEKGHSVDSIGNFTSPISDELRNITRKIYNLPLQRTPFSFKNLFALKKLIKIIKENKYDVVHVHTPIASVIGRIACFFTKTKCFYTAHGFHFYKGAPPLNWLLYFPVEWILSFVTDTLITINKEDYEFAKNHLHAKRTEYIPGVGINIEKFANVKVDIKAKRKELGIPENCKLILSVGELNKNKNHQVVLKALAELKDTNIHYAICGKGELRNYLLDLARSLNVSERFHLLGIREDIAEILKCGDIFVHPSLREGLPVALMEAMASGLPCIASKIRGNIDLIQDNVNGFIAEDYSPTTYVKLIKKQICKNCDDKALNQEYSYRFGIDRIIVLIGSLYE